MKNVSVTEESIESKFEGCEQYLRVFEYQDMTQTPTKKVNVPFCINPGRCTYAKKSVEKSVEYWIYPKCEARKWKEYLSLAEPGTLAEP